MKSDCNVTNLFRTSRRQKIMSGGQDLKELESLFLIKFNSLWGKSNVWRKLLQKATSKIVFPHTTKNFMLFCVSLFFPLLFSSRFPSFLPLLPKHVLHTKANMSRLTVKRPGIIHVLHNTARLHRLTVLQHKLARLDVDDVVRMRSEAAVNHLEYAPVSFADLLSTSGENQIVVFLHL